MRDCLSSARASVQASGLSSDLRHKLRGALQSVVATKRLMPSNITFTVICATRWGLTSMRPGSGVASPDNLIAMPHSNAGLAGAGCTPLKGQVQQVRDTTTHDF